MRFIVSFIFSISSIMAFTQKIQSELCILNPDTKKVRIVYQADYHLEAPNWTQDGKHLIFNSKGCLYKISVAGGSPEKIETGFADKCNNDHVLSPDGNQIAVSHHTVEDGLSRIYIIDFNTGEPILITPMAPSYLHGWSPIKNELAYCAERNGQYDVYSINIDTKEEVQLSNEEGLDDGPEYSPDGKYIYFNSTRTGTMQIWRMKSDGSEPTQLTFDDENDWFAHPSPDNKWLVFVSFGPEVEADKHPPGKHVKLRRMPIDGGDPETLLELFGGQGTINVPSWSPDSKEFAFVRYAE